MFSLPAALRDDPERELVPRHDPRVDHGRRIVLRVHALERIAEDRLAEIAFRVAAAHALVDRLVEGAPRDVGVLADIDEHDGEPRVLADRHPLGAGDTLVLEELVEYFLPDRGLLGAEPALERGVDVLLEIEIRLLREARDGVGDLLRVDLTDRRGRFGFRHPPPHFEDSSSGSLFSESSGLKR